jgi:thiamine-phosphate pyrophosphorylase
MEPDLRRERLSRARLYFVCDAGFEPVELDALLGQAFAGGVDVVQLRDKSAPPAALRAAASVFSSAAAEHGALFFVNDDPALAGECGADGVHVGQEDAAVATAREIAGGGALVGLSTHAPDQLDAVLAAEGPARPDYVSVGPVWETPTKPGRPASGLGYVRYAAEHAGAGDLPWFAIGSIEPSNIGEVLDAGAERVVVVRAIRSAEDPAAVARKLRAAVGAGVRDAGPAAR